MYRRAGSVLMGHVLGAALPLPRLLAATVPAGRRHPDASGHPKAGARPTGATPAAGCLSVRLPAPPAPPPAVGTRGSQRPQLPRLRKHHRHACTLPPTARPLRPGRSGMAVSVPGRLADRRGAAVVLLPCDSDPQMLRCAALRCLPVSSRAGAERQCACVGLSARERGRAHARGWERSIADRKGGGAHAREATRSIAVAPGGAVRMRAGLPAALRPGAGMRTALPTAPRTGGRGVVRMRISVRGGGVVAVSSACACVRRLQRSRGGAGGRLNPREGVGRGGRAAGRCGGRGKCCAGEGLPDGEQARTRGAEQGREGSGGVGNRGGVRTPGRRAEGRDQERKRDGETQNGIERMK